MRDNSHCKPAIFLRCYGCYFLSYVIIKILRSFVFENTHFEAWLMVILILNDFSCLGCCVVLMGHLKIFISCSLTTCVCLGIINILYS
jgi:hypothetical protein